MSWRIVMIDSGEYLRLKLDNLYIKKGKKDYTIPLSDISMIVVENLDAVLTSRLLDACTLHNIVLAICDYKHQPSGIFYGLNTHSRASKVIKQQIKWTNTFKDSIWAEIVKHKLMNQQLVLMKYTTHQDAIELLSQYVNTIKLGDKTNREGHGAKVYFNALFGKEFTRDLNAITNHCLDYLYAIVRAFFTRLVVAYGYCGMIGLHHKSEYNNFNLVDDLMEPFRPLCDEYILNNLEEDTVFDLDMRIKLVDFLNSYTVYENKKMMMINVMEKYMHSFIKCCKNGQIENLSFPIIHHE